MRRKIKELMNKEEGFTLVELLAVIVILGIIVAIAIPSIGRVMDNARGGATKAEEELVLDAARLYSISETNEDGTQKTGDVSIPEDLVKKGYLEVKKGESYTGSVTIAKQTGGGYTYTLNNFKKVKPAADPSGV